MMKHSYITLGGLFVAWLWDRLVRRKNRKKQKPKRKNEDMIA